MTSRCDKTRKGVTLYLIEPQVCEYVLAVESPSLCQAMENYENLINNNSISNENVSEKKSNSNDDQSIP